MPDMWRLFIAIEIPPSVLVQITDLQDQLKTKIPLHTVRWVQPKGIHLTLKFLGDVPAIKRSTLENTLAKAVEKHSPFTLTATNLGCFPNLNHPRVVWVGVQQNLTALMALRNAIEDSIAPLGYPTENRAFNPHLTLGRIQRDARQGDIQRVADLIAKTEYSHHHTWQVNDVQLIRSELKPFGAEYTTLFHASLKAQ